MIYPFFSTGTLFLVFLEAYIFFRDIDSLKGGEINYPVIPFAALPGSGFILFDYNFLTLRIDKHKEAIP